MNANERKNAWKILWRNTHKDFRGMWCGEQSIMSNAKYGGGLVTCESITEEELLERTAAWKPSK